MPRYAKKCRTCSSWCSSIGWPTATPTNFPAANGKRVALARALAVEPKVLLLDEPFGALDAKVRQELRSWLRRLHDDIHVTSVFVTHDQEEALEVADRIVVMNHGKIEQEGAPDAVYQKPANAFVYHFLGNLNLFHARMENGDTFLGAPAPVSSMAPPNGQRADGLRFDPTLCTSRSSRPHQPKSPSQEESAISTPLGHW